MHQCQPQSSHAGPLITTQLLPPSLSFPSLTPLTLHFQQLQLPSTTTLTPLTLHFQQLQLPSTTTLTPLTLHFQQLQLPSTLFASQTSLMPMTPTTLKARRSWRKETGSPSALSLSSRSACPLVWVGVRRIRNRSGSVRNRSRRRICNRSGGSIRMRSGRRICNRSGGSIRNSSGRRICNRSGGSVRKRSIPDRSRRKHF
jgi:hypothetical protein